MANSLKLLYFLIVLLAASLQGMAKARPLGSSSTLLTRLKLDDEAAGCWETLIQLQACSGEIILFFVNGETYLGPGCCQAIQTITQHCWPAMIDTLGFTSEEGHILEGYCEKSQDSLPASGSGEVVVKGSLVP